MRENVWKPYTRGVISKLFKTLLQLNSQTQNPKYPSYNWVKDPNRSFSKRDGATCREEYRSKPISPHSKTTMRMVVVGRKEGGRKDMWHFFLPLLGHSPKEIKSLSLRDVCNPVFLASLFPSLTYENSYASIKMHERIKKIYMHNGILLSLWIKENPVIFDSSVESGGHTNWNKPDPKGKWLSDNHEPEESKIFLLIQAKDRMVPARGWWRWETRRK